MRIRGAGPISATLLLVLVTFGFATPISTPGLQAGRGLTRSEALLRRSPTHISEFTPLDSGVTTFSCAASRPPEALATPDPLLQLDGSAVRVSFIVDSGGRVVSPFILESAGVTDDEIVLSAVRYWRFRPALCNGVPMPMEGKVQFMVAAGVAQTGPQKSR